MANKNYSDTIKSVQDRTLTAKGYKFVTRCIDIIAANKGLHRYSPEMKPYKEKFRLIMLDLFIDKRMTIQQVTDLIKSRKFIE